MKRKDAAEIRRATEEDYEGILSLQRRYYVERLNAKTREGGFLSAEFTLPQIVDMAEGLGIMVSRCDDRVVAYMCASRVDEKPRPPILDAMMECLETAVFRGKLLRDSTAFVYGPVCVDEAFRGVGVLREMFEALKTLLADRFEVGVAFVADENAHSLAAHLKGLSMQSVARFRYSGKDYHAVAFSVR